MLTRIKTAGAMLAVLAVLAYLDIWFLNFLVFAAIVGIGFFESLTLYKIEKWQLIFFALLSFVLFSFYSHTFEGAYKFIVILLISIASYLAYANRKNTASILPFFYPLTPIFIMFSVYDALGIKYLLFIIFIVMATDSGAYFVGKLIGRHKFTSTSPNKTIEGVIGGVVFGVLVGFIYNKYALETITFDIFSIILITAFSVFGDLFESYLKRKAGVKDSGNIFPGHGGMLDRIDALLFASVMLSLVVAW